MSPADTKLPSAPVADHLLGRGALAHSMTVRLSSELVHLLSDQMYQSAAKAIEELVVNSYDADATTCRVSVPDDPAAPQTIIVFDDGAGMDQAGLVDLWHIGRSHKRDEELERRAKRKQIGKFGIGKLATYAVANQITYLTRRDGGDVHGVTLDFRSFKVADEDKPVPIEIRVFSNVGELVKLPVFVSVCALLDVQASVFASSKSWTVAVLEALKPKAATLRLGVLRRVLSTAMPLQSGFRLVLNGEDVLSAKEQIEAIISFSVADLSATRLKSLATETGEKWVKRGDTLVADSFPSGVGGRVVVTKQSLHSGKSDDLMRSHGFFIRVRGRLINQGNALFDLNPLAYQTFNRFRADVDADDLDADLKAPREGVESSDLKSKFQKLLGELYYEARSRYEKWTADQERALVGTNEHHRNYVTPQLVERPLADVLATQPDAASGAEADDSWFYLDIDPSTDVKALTRALYDQPRARYTYAETNAGANARFVQFNPADATFYLNVDHELVRAHSENAKSRVLLEDIATAEALLEVYLREHLIPAAVVGEILERRDALLRSLTRDHPYSLETLEASLVAAASDKTELEIALVAALRALGFVAAHVGNAGKPDGVARFIDYPAGEIKITLEAKSSADVPSLASIDFAGLRDHMEDAGAAGCLLVAPRYPGSTLKADAKAARRAEQNRISCWTVADLARLVGSAEARHLNARHVLQIVTTTFAPDAVRAAVDALFADPSWNVPELSRAILQALRSLEDRLVDIPRDVSMIAAELSRLPEFAGLKANHVERALSDLKASSRGALDMTVDRVVVLHASIDEIERRLSSVTNEPGAPRRPGSFRNQS